MNGNPRLVLCFGELLLRLSSPRGEGMLQGTRLDAHFGGAEGNVAVALARLDPLPGGVQPACVVHGAQPQALHRRQRRRILRDPGREPFRAVGEAAFQQVDVGDVVGDQRLRRIGAELPLDVARDADRLTLVATPAELAA